MEICPECGSNVLKCHHWFYDPETQKWSDVGIFHEYKQMEPGSYTCECGNIFTIHYNEETNQLEII